MKIIIHKKDLINQKNINRIELIINLVSFKP